MTDNGFHNKLKLLLDEYVEFAKKSKLHGSVVVGYRIDFYKGNPQKQTKIFADVHSSINPE